MFDLNVFRSNFLNLGSSVLISTNMSWFRQTRFFVKSAVWKVREQCGPDAPVV